MPRQTTRQTVEKARRLRSAMSLPEVLLWNCLRRAPLGVKFRRQHPAGPFVLDFYCPAAKLAIEVDGVSHAMGNRPERDEARDTFLQARRIETLRIAAAEVLRSAASVADSIVIACIDRSMAPPPPPAAAVPLPMPAAQGGSEAD